MVREKNKLGILVMKHRSETKSKIISEHGCIGLNSGINYEH